MSRRLQSGLNRMQWVHSLDMVTQPCTKTLDASWTTAVWVGGPGRARSWRRACIPYRYRTPLHFNHIFLLTYPSPFPPVLRTMVAEVICVKSG